MTLVVTVSSIIFLYCSHNIRISDMYVRLRSTEFGTPRLIESIIRISTAIAKARLSKTVQSRDVKDAEKIFNESYIKNL